MKSVKNWKWFGHAGHLIVGRDCRFHLCTKVGRYLISTVGEYWPCREVREIHAKINSPGWFSENSHLRGDDFDFAYMRKFGFEEIGCDRKYETMVFLAGKECNFTGCNCGIPQISGRELDFLPYNDSGSAAIGHLNLCNKWSKKK